MSALRALPFTEPITESVPESVPEWAERVAQRALLREFLRCVPADEPEATLELQMPDGRLRQITRGALTARIRWLRPRMRRIVECQLIGHMGREQVCRELVISTKTFERDQAEALDILLAEAREC